MNILNSMQQFPDEVSCVAYLKGQKEQSGIAYKRCGYNKAQEVIKSEFDDWHSTKFIIALRVHYRNIEDHLAGIDYQSLFESITQSILIMFFPRMM